MAGRVATSLAREGMRALLDGRSRSDRSGAAKRSKAPKTPGTVATPQHSRGGGRRSPASNAPADTGYRGDWHGALPATSWQAKDDGRPDPGEIVWAWVPYEEDHTQGKDRPVLVVAPTSVVGTWASEAAKFVPDLVVLPGSKSTVGDLAWLRERGLADALVRRAAAGGP